MSMTLDPTNPDPLYRQLADRLKAEIDTGRYEPGDQLPTHRELADQFGVSLITVKHALAELVGDGLVYSRVGRGTFVTKRTPAKPAAATKVLGMVLRDLQSPFFSLVVQAVEEAAYEAGYSLMLSAASGQISKEVRQIEHFREIGVDGLIIASMQPDHVVPQTVRALHEARFPYVMVSYVEDEDIYFVGTDHEQGAYQATSHLIEQGYTRIGFLAAEASNRLSLLRERGFTRALTERGLTAEAEWIYRMADEGEWNHYTSGYRAGQQVASARKRPEAVFAYNDLLALGFMQALVDVNLKVPEDMALVGFDDIARSQYAQVPLSTIRQRTTEIGRCAVEVLLSSIEGKPVRRRTYLPPELIVRASSSLSVRRPATSTTR